MNTPFIQYNEVLDYFVIEVIKKAALALRTMNQRTQI
jgi:hypothetical protein